MIESYRSNIFDVMILNGDPSHIPWLRDIPDCSAREKVGNRALYTSAIQFHGMFSVLCQWTVKFRGQIDICTS